MVVIRMFSLCFFCEAAEAQEGQEQIEHAAFPALPDIVIYTGSSLRALPGNVLPLYALGAANASGNRRAARGFR